MSQENQAPRRVGERLRQAREQQGIAIADAAEQLHILASYIKALESGRYGVLPGTVFLRGYVRSYARLLQLDADEIVAQLDRELGATEESKGAGPVVATPKPGVRDAGKWLGLAALALLLVGLLWSFQQQDSFMSSEPVSSTVEQTPSGEESIDEPEVAHPEAAFDYDPESTEPVDRPAAYDDDTAPLAEEGLPEMPAEESSTGIASQPQATNGSSTVEAVPSNGAPEEAVTDLAVQPESSEAAPPSATETESLDRLEVTFSGDSWFELTDADGNRRMGLFRAGQSLNHEGPAPFRIVVGAVTETSMRFNGVEVDFSNYRVRNNRAGLTLGQ